MSQNWTPPPPPSGAPGTAIPNYLVLAILSVFCCWPLAIVAIINATKVNNLAAAGDTQGAMTASAAAKKWAYIALGLGIAFWVIFGIIYIVFAAAILSSAR
jgi:hypothetical protein